MKEQLKNGIIKKVENVTQKKLCIYHTKLSYAETKVLRVYFDASEKSRSQFERCNV